MDTLTLQFDTLVENGIATRDEVLLVANINGWNEETMLDILYAKTGLRSWEQLSVEFSI